MASSVRAEMALFRRKRVIVRAESRDCWGRSCLPAAPGVRLASYVASVTGRNARASGRALIRIGIIVVARIGYFADAVPLISSRDVRAEIDRGRMRVAPLSVLTDQPSEGPPLLLLHGFPEALFVWFLLPARSSNLATPQSMFATAESPTDPAPATGRRGVR